MFPPDRSGLAAPDVEAALTAILEDPDVAEVHVRNLLAQCFVARAVRSTSAARNDATAQYVL